jgi:YgiT-type zinc finger domain-containing protein
MTTEPVKNKRCPLCGGGLREELATLPFVVKGSVVVVKGVAAEVCADCGEAFLGGKDVDAVTALLQDAVNHHVELTIVPLSRETFTSS